MTASALLPLLRQHPLRRLLVLGQLLVLLLGSTLPALALSAQLARGGLCSAVGTAPASPTSPTPPTDDALHADCQRACLLAQASLLPLPQWAAAPLLSLVEARPHEALQSPCPAAALSPQARDPPAR